MGRGTAGLRSGRHGDTSGRLHFRLHRAGLALTPLPGTQEVRVPRGVTGRSTGNPLAAPLPSNARVARAHCLGLGSGPAPLRARPGRLQIRGAGAHSDAFNSCVESRGSRCGGGDGRAVAVPTLLGTFPHTHARIAAPMRPSPRPWPRPLLALTPRPLWPHRPRTRRRCHAPPRGGRGAVRASWPEPQPRATGSPRAYAPSCWTPFPPLGC